MFKWLKDKIQTKERARGEFTDTDRKKSEMVRAEKSLKATYYEVQKEILDAKKEQLEEMKSKIQMQNMDDKIQRMQEELEDYDDDETDNSEGMLASLGMKNEDAQLIKGLMGIVDKLKPQNGNVIQTPNAPQPFTQPTDVSDEEILNYLNKLPSITRAGLKKMNDSDLIKTIKVNMPDLTEKTTLRTVELIKNV